MEEWIKGCQRKELGLSLGGGRTSKDQRERENSFWISWYGEDALNSGSVATFSCINGKVLINEGCREAEF